MYLTDNGRRIYGRKADESRQYDEFLIFPNIYGDERYDIPSEKRGKIVLKYIKVAVIVENRDDCAVGWFYTNDKKSF